MQCNFMNIEALALTVGLEWLTFPMKYGNKSPTSDTISFVFLYYLQSFRRQMVYVGLALQMLNPFLSKNSKSIKRYILFQIKPDPFLSL